MDVYHGSSLGFNSLRINVAELWMDVNITVLMKPTPNSPRPAAPTLQNHQNRNSRAVNRQNADPATVPEGSRGKTGKDIGKDIWVPTGSCSCRHGNLARAGT